MKKILVTGGAGYIGSHVVKLLVKAGFKVLVYDNLSTGHESAVKNAKLVVGDLADKTLFYNTLIDFKPDAVMHFAAFIQVGESVGNPIKYYQNNTANALNLLEAMQELGINKFLFSSTAAVYGIPEKMPVTEATDLSPINPYGQSKAFVEKILADQSTAGKINYVALRYFNVAGADPEGDLGQNYLEATHLITGALKAAKGERSRLQLYGTDYDTPDGTCVRDYIHVNDLASAHIMALNYLLAGNKSDIFNLGYGHGFSVKEVIEVVKKVTGVNFLVEEVDRRAGDPPALIADSRKIKTKLLWKPEYDNLEFIVKTAWEWERKL